MTRWPLLLLPAILSATSQSPTWTREEKPTTAITGFFPVWMSRIHLRNLLRMHGIESKFLACGAFWIIVPTKDADKAKRVMDEDKGLHPWHYYPAYDAPANLELLYKLKPVVLKMNVPISGFEKDNKFNSNKCRSTIARRAVAIWNVVGRERPKTNSRIVAMKIWETPYLGKDLAWREGQRALISLTCNEYKGRCFTYEICSWNDGKDEEVIWGPPMYSCGMTIPEEFMFPPPPGEVNFDTITRLSDNDTIAFYRTKVDVALQSELRPRLH